MLPRVGSADFAQGLGRGDGDENVSVVQLMDKRSGALPVAAVGQRVDQPDLEIRVLRARQSIPQFGGSLRRRIGRQGAAGGLADQRIGVLQGDGFGLDALAVADPLKLLAAARRGRSRAWLE